MTASSSSLLDRSSRRRSAVQSNDVPHKAGPELDAANYLVGGDYERKISAAWFWNAGASWYRNDDAGILNRYIVFGGVGNTWADNQRRRFVTSYGVSYTDREEEEPDPERSAVWRRSSRVGLYRAPQSSDDVRQRSRGERQFRRPV